MIYFTYDYQLLFKIVLVVWTGFRIFRAIRYKKINIFREILLWGLFLYISILLFRTFEPFTILLEREGQRANFKPLQGILLMIEKASIFDQDMTRRIVFINIVGNILIFSPLGMTIPLLEKRLNRGWLVVLLGLSFSLMIELAQTFLIGRVFDVDDLILNSFGTLVGFLVYAMVNLINPVRIFFDRVRDAARPNALLYAFVFVLIVAAATAGIYHYGYELFKQIPQ